MLATEPPRRQRVIFATVSWRFDGNKTEGELYLLSMEALNGESKSPALSHELFWFLTAEDIVIADHHSFEVIHPFFFRFLFSLKKEIEKTNGEKESRSTRVAPRYSRKY